MGFLENSAFPVTIPDMLALAPFLYPQDITMQQRRIIHEGRPHLMDASSVPNYDLMDPLFARPTCMSTIGNQNFIVGELHADIFPKQILIENMELLATAGYKIFYLEHVISDTMQAWLDQAFLTRGRNFHPALRSFLITMGRGQSATSRFATARDMDDDTPSAVPTADVPGDSVPTFDYLTLVRVAFEHGIRVVALDSTLSYSVDNNYRHRMFSWQAFHAIYHTNNGKPWFALIGNSHAIRYKNIPGLQELTGASSFMVYDNVQSPPIPPRDSDTSSHAITRRMEIMHYTHFHALETQQSRVIIRTLPAGQNILTGLTMRVDQSAPFRWAYGTSLLEKNAYLRALIIPIMPQIPYRGMQAYLVKNQDRSTEYENKFNFGVPLSAKYDALMALISSHPMILDNFQNNIPIPSARFAAILNASALNQEQKNALKNGTLYRAIIGE